METSHVQLLKVRTWPMSLLCSLFLPNSYKLVSSQTGAADEEAHSWENTLCSLMAEYIWPKLSAASKQNLRLTSTSARAVADSSVSRVELTTKRDAADRYRIKRWQPQALVVHPPAMREDAWFPSPYFDARAFTAQLQSLTLQGPQLFPSLVKVSSFLQESPCAVHA
jgi:hypothetical protein